MLTFLREAWFCWLAPWTSAIHLCHMYALALELHDLLGIFFLKDFHFHYLRQKCLDAINANFLDDKMPDRKLKWACQVRCSCSIEWVRERLPSTVARLRSCHTIVFCMRFFFYHILFLGTGKERLLLFLVQYFSQPAMEKKEKNKIKWENSIVWFLEGEKVSSFQMSPVSVAGISCCLPGWKAEDEAVAPLCWVQEWQSPFPSNASSPAYEGMCTSAEWLLELDTRHPEE